MEETMINTADEQGSISVNENTEYVFNEEQFREQLQEEVGEGSYVIGPFGEGGPTIQTNKEGYIEYVVALRKAAELWASTHQKA